MKSIIKWLNDEKGHGFIEYNENDILIHYCAFREQENVIEFELTNTDNDYMVKNVASI